MDYWTPRGMVQGLDRLDKTAAATVDWIETRLGDYPFDSLGLVVTDSQSAMETQTMVTLGTNDYVLSPQVSRTSSSTSGTATRSRRPTGATCGSTRA